MCRFTGAHTHLTVSEDYILRAKCGHQIVPEHNVMTFVEWEGVKFMP